MSSQLKEILEATIAYIEHQHTLESNSEEDSDSENENNKRLWVRPWIKERELGDIRKGSFVLIDDLLLSDPIKLKNYLRMDITTFNYLANSIKHLIIRKDTHYRKAITVNQRVAMALRYLASGESYTSMHMQFRVGLSTISEIVPEVLEALWTVLSPVYLKIPNSEVKWLAIADKYHSIWNMPNCIGSLDGKHIYIQACRDAGSMFYNYKQTHSIVLMALCDAERNFTYIDVGCNGRASDGSVLNNCSLINILENPSSVNIPKPRSLPERHIPLPFFIVGYDAFPLKDNLMKPYPRRGLTI